MGGIIVFIWEQWRQTNKALGAMLLGLALYAVAAWKFRDLLYYIFSNSEPLVVSCAYLPALGAVALLFLQENRGRVGFAYPRRMLVLPVHTFVLVAAPLAYRLFIVGVFGYLSGLLCDTFFKELYFKGPEVLALLTLVAAIHAYVFLTCGFGAATGTAIFAGAFLVGLPGLYEFMRNTTLNLAIPSPLDPVRIPPDLGYGGIPVALAVLPYWLAVAYIGARHARSEVAEDPVGGLVRIATRVTYFDRERAEFDSPEAAQQWFEWRRGAYLFPWLSLVVGLALTVLLYFTSISTDPMLNRFLISFNLFAVAPAVIASIVGYTVTRGGNEYQWFVGARPLDTATIGKARLRAGMKAVLWAYILSAMVYVVAFKIMFPHDPIIASLVQDLRVITSTQGTFQQGLVLLAFLTVCVVLSSGSLFWLARVSGVLVCVALAVVGGAYYAWGGTLYHYDPVSGEFVSAATPFITAMAGLLGVCGVCAVLVAIWRRYIPILALAAVLAAWLILTIVALKMQYAVAFGGPVVAAAWMLMPFIPLASIPLTLEWQRHR